MVSIASVDRLEPFIEPPFYISVGEEVCIRWIINKVDQKKNPTKTYMLRHCLPVMIDHSIALGLVDSFAYCILLEISCSYACHFTSVN